MGWSFIQGEEYQDIMIVHASFPYKVKVKVLVSKCQIANIFWEKN